MTGSRKTSDIQSLRDLLVWQKGVDLSEACYRVTSGFPKAEAYGFRSQLRRCSVSVPSNIAKGFGRETTGSFVQHLRIAQGSLKDLGSVKELETKVMISQRVVHCAVDAGNVRLSQSEEIGHMLRAQIRSRQQPSGD